MGRSLNEVIKSLLSDRQQSIMQRSNQLAREVEELQGSENLSSLDMNTQSMPSMSELAEQLVQLSPGDRLYLIQSLAQSLNEVWNPTRPLSTEDLVSFFQRSPLAEAIADGEDLDLSRND